MGCGVKVIHWKLFKKYKFSKQSYWQEVKEIHWKLFKKYKFSKKKVTGETTATYESKLP